MKIEAIGKDNRDLFLMVDDKVSATSNLKGLDKHFSHSHGDASSALLEDIFEAMEDGIALYDKDLNFVLCNRQYNQLAFPDDFRALRSGESAFGIGKEVFSSGFFVAPIGTNAEGMAKFICNFIRSCTLELELERADGRHLSVSSRQTSLGGYLLSFRDITDRKEVEKTAEKKLETINDAVGALEEGVALWDEDLRFILCNQQYIDMQLPPGEQGPSVGESAYDFARRLYEYFKSPEGTSIHEFAAATVNQLKNYNENMDFHRRDGAVLRVSIKRTGLGGYLITLLDITEERNSEAKAQTMLLDAIHSLDEGLCLYDKDMRFVAANKAWADIYWGTNRPEFGDHASHILNSLIDRGFYSWPEGVTRPEFIASVLNAIMSYTKGLKLETADGRYLVGSSHATELGGYLLSCRNVTKQIETEKELERQQAISHQNEKLSALGELLAGVAHELNNPLSVVFGYAQMLEDKVDDPVINERIGLIRQSSERAAKIVKTFLAMARQRPIKTVAFSLNDAINTALEVSSYSLKANGTQVYTNLDQALPLVDADFDQMAQVFSNLIVNAGHALKDLGDRGQLSICSYFDKKADRVIVEIKDNGLGIPEKIQTRIFEPFFTTKEVGEGTGVGLAFSHRIITSYDGELTLISRPGEGAMFKVILPASEEYICSATVSEEMDEGPKQKTVLIVDDEEGVAQLIYDLLSEQGFQPMQSTSPQSALNILESQTFDLILSDFKMPGMDGEDFYQALKVIAPECVDRIGFITGDAMSEKVMKFFEMSGRPHIEKPILNEELMELVSLLSPNDEVH
ncbi:PAS-domain containing protein [Kordiimonas sp. SCSIO 12610]|uniref:hybrid sensor histidine kinase/response regulator n=1 Tax=Kordiimonas sp. SCSIO 12610 TaxID=2829597 RepID=UPI0021092220|nr:PAS-domain containing protein [Kordiimonas sp. SCSIO 12610]UTW54365.1 PAS-domain containing protein [Kordiimonas sp. SCSIO 12610]